MAAPAHHLRPKSAKWGVVLGRIRQGMGLAEAVKVTAWPTAHQWRRWIERQPERESQLAEALAEGARMNQDSIQERGIAAFGKWLTRVEAKLEEGDALSAKEIDTLKVLADSKLKDLRQQKLAPEKAKTDEDAGWYD